MSTRRAVAAAAGVSVRTVSNVVNGFAHVAPETRARVLAAIEEHGYRPSEVARTLRVGRSGLVGLMLPELANPYFAELTRSFVERGAELGLTIVIDQTDGDRERELAFVERTARGALFDALVLSPMALSVADLERSTDGRHVVLLGEEEFPGFDKVMIDNHAAVHDLVAHMVTRGRRRIAAVGAEKVRHGTSVQRLDGFRSALVVAGLAVGDDFIQFVDKFQPGDGALAAGRLLDLDEPPDAILCFTDSLAVGVLRLLHERGVDVPGEIMVAGIDDIAYGRFAVPSLTSVSPDKDWIARISLDRITRRLTGEDIPPATLVGRHAIVERESTGAAAVASQGKN